LARAVAFITKWIYIGQKDNTNTIKLFGGTFMKKLANAALILAVAGMLFVSCKKASGGVDSALFKAVNNLTKNSKWELVQSIPLAFPSGHPQGLVKIGEFFYVSTVEIITPTQRYPELRDGYDRDTGEGAGFVYKFDKSGTLLAQVSLGEGAMYHPGGIDYDGAAIWVPAAEYRPNSASIIYKVDPASMTAQKVFEYKDHIGGVVHDTENNAIHGVSWGSRRFYRWQINKQGQVSDTSVPREQLMALNPQHYIDYQDCHYIGNGKMLCSGLATYNYSGGSYRLGGIEIIDLKTNLPVHQVPVELFSPVTGRPMTQNPFWMEENGGVITAYFIPDDDVSTMYVYKVTP
jgi:hypothetical protein